MILTRKSKRGVAPVIATLLLVAIAVVGGSIIFVFSQGFFSSSQISAIPAIEYIEIIGYDTRDVKQVKAHDGIDILPKNCCGIVDNLKNVDERISIHLQNNSVQQVFISEIRIGGAAFNYATTPATIGNWNGGTAPQPGEYVILTGHDGMPGGDVLQDFSPSMQGGEIITILVDLDRIFLEGRDIQFHLTTVKGGVFVSTIFMGHGSS